MLKGMLWILLNMLSEFFYNFTDHFTHNDTLFLLLPLYTVSIGLENSEGKKHLFCNVIQIPFFTSQEYVLCSSVPLCKINSKLAEIEKEGWV